MKQGIVVQFMLMAMSEEICVMNEETNEEFKVEVPDRTFDTWTLLISMKRN